MNMAPSSSTAEPGAESDEPLRPGVVRKAVIDIGTNSVKLLVGDVSGGSVTPVVERSEQTRLGRGFYESHRLQPGAIAHTTAAVAEFADMARAHEAGVIRIVATSAVRDAGNAGELLDAIHRRTSLTVEIISGELEAEWAFRGVTSDPSLASQPLLILDVGGGSTEFIVGEAGELVYRNSFQLGTVRLLETSHFADPPTAEQRRTCMNELRAFFERWIMPELSPALQSFKDRPMQLVGTGGTTTILARMELAADSFDRASIESVTLTDGRLRELSTRLWEASLTERKTIVGVPSNRADVIPLGAAIYETVMTLLPLRQLRVSTRGLRFGALISRAI